MDEAVNRDGTIRRILPVEASSESSSEDSAGVRTGARGTWRDWEKKDVCFVVGEVRNGKVRGFCDRESVSQMRFAWPSSRVGCLPCAQFA